MMTKATETLRYAANRQQRARPACPPEPVFFSRRLSAQREVELALSFIEIGSQFVFVHRLPTAPILVLGRYRQVTGSRSS